MSLFAKLLPRSPYFTQHFAGLGLLLDMSTSIALCQSRHRGFSLMKCFPLKKKNWPGNEANLYIMERS